MKLVLLIGPHAVGKMTVGQELEKLTGLKLFHNHMTIDMVAPFFSYSEPTGRALVHTLRDAFFRAFADSDAPGYIFTFVWAFGEPGEREYIEGITKLFEDKGHTVTWIELEADLDKRLKRNLTENRLAHKPTKRDTAWSEGNLLKAHKDHRLNSHEGEIAQHNYLRINTNDLSATAVAHLVKDHIA